MLMRYSFSYSIVMGENKEDENELSLILKRSNPISNYLAENVLSSISVGLDKLARERPDDPIDFLARFLKDNCRRRVSSGNISSSSSESDGVAVVNS